MNQSDAFWVGSQKFNPLHSEGSWDGLAPAASGGFQVRLREESLFLFVQVCLLKMAF